MQHQNINELKRLYELAEARYVVANQLGTYLAVTFGIMIYFSLGNWWAGVLAFVFMEFGVRYEYKRPFISAEKSYWDAVNAE